MLKMKAALLLLALLALTGCASPASPASPASRPAAPARPDGDLPDKRVTLDPALARNFANQRSS